VPDDAFYTLTALATGSGSDRVTVNLKEGGNGAFSLETETGDDWVDGSASTLPLVIFGGDGNDAIYGGSGADVIFGDIGRVDYAKRIPGGPTQIVTRLGQTWPSNPQNPPISSATPNGVRDDSANFPIAYGGLVGLDVQLIAPDGYVQHAP